MQPQILAAGERWNNIPDRLRKQIIMLAQKPVGEDTNQVEEDIERKALSYREPTRTRALTEYAAAQTARSLGKGIEYVTSYVKETLKEIAHTSKEKNPEELLEQIEHDIALLPQTVNSLFAEAYNLANQAHEIGDPRRYTESQLAKQLATREF